MKEKPFNIIRKAGDPTKVTLVARNGKEYTISKPQKDRIYVPEEGGFIRCAPYGIHFIFEVPKIFQGWAHLCSCGGAAVITGSKAYEHLGSPAGKMFVCHIHTMTNKHADGAS